VQVSRAASAALLQIALASLTTEWSRVQALAGKCVNEGCRPA